MVICVFCFHLKLDSDQNVFKFSPDEAFFSFVSLECFPLSPLEEATAPGGRNSNRQRSDRILRSDLYANIPVIRNTELNS